MGTNTISFMFAFQFLILFTFSELPSSGSNGKESTVNRALGDSTYPSQKLVHFSLCNFFLLLWNTATYTWDWYCHLVGDRASLAPFRYHLCWKDQILPILESSSYLSILTLLGLSLANNYIQFSSVLYTMKIWRL